MKKLISCLLVVMMLASITVAFAESPAEESFDTREIISRYLDETDTKTQDIALQYQSGNEATDLVISIDGDNTHLVWRDNAVEKSHLQVNPTGIYMGADGHVTLLRYATVTSAANDFIKDIDTMMEQTIQSIPKEQIPTDAEIRDALSKLAKVAIAVETQEQADAATLTSAALSFASKFKPEYVLDVQGDDSYVEVSLRSDAYATALAEAMDEMMLNPALANLVNRSAAAYGGAAFADIQEEWIANREDILDAIRSAQSTEYIDEDGHYVSHFQIGDELFDEKILMCDTDAWVDAEENTMEMTATIGFEDEEPVIVHELAVSPDYYGERMTSGDSYTVLQMNLEDNRTSSGEVLNGIEGNEELRADIGPDYMFVKGPNGAISTTERETWTGKHRIELVVETADGEEARIINDFYQDDDESLICELNSTGSDHPAIFRLSRIGKVNYEDLSASKNIIEFPADQVKALLPIFLAQMAS